MTGNTAGAHMARPNELESVQHARFGALPERDGVRFRVFAPAASDLRLIVSTGAAAGVHRPQGERDGIFEFFIQGAGS